MTLDVGAVGTSTGPRLVTIEPSGAALYALAIGGGSRELQYAVESTAERPQRVYGTYLATLTDDAGRLLVAAGVDDLSVAIHGAQRMTFVRSVQPDEQLSCTTSLTSLTDATRHAVAMLETSFVDGDDLVAMLTQTVVLRGLGGFDGPAAPTRRRAPMPRRPADLSASWCTSPDQALLYRLTGDRNPLHAEPAAAEAAGFPTPILHGLCTFGASYRMLLESLHADTPDVIASISARFERPVIPGEELVLEAWCEGCNAIFQVRAGDDRRVCLADGEVLLDHEVSAAPPLTVALTHSEEEITQ